MLTLHPSGVWLVNGALQTAPPAGTEAAAARGGPIAAQILQAHNAPAGDGRLHLTFDSLTSHDLTYVGIIQTARASGLERFPMPYVLTNCHNALCAVGGTINEDDHKFALSAARKYGGIYVPPNVAVIHSYNREVMAGGGRMILGSDSHTRYGALGPMGVGEGGGELAKQLLRRTYDMQPPEVGAVYLTGKPGHGVGPQDVALALVGTVYKNNFVKNKVMEFVGPGVASLPVEYRNGIDVMTTETACWSSIWATDAKVEEYLALHGRAGDYQELQPAPLAYYDSCIELDLSAIEPMIALPMHPSNAFSIREFRENAGDILRETERAANEQLGGRVTLDLCSKWQDGAFQVQQGVVAGCSGGTYDNLCTVANILRGQSCGNGAFALNIYAGSLPAYAALVKNGAFSEMVSAGAIIRECFCGPCFGAGDTPANGELSIRHTTRNFPNREGSKPGEGQLAAVALMDARSIAATAANGGRLTSAAEVDYDEAIPPYTFDAGLYQKRVLNAWQHPEPKVSLVMGPNIKDWPAMPALSEDLLLQVVSHIEDPVTTTDELIPSGETGSFRSNPERLSEFALSRRDPGYVPAAKAVRTWERSREAGEPLPAEVEAAYAAFRAAGVAVDPANTVLGSTIYATKPGDGSAREQAASCQRVLGGAANLVAEYATKRYRSNCINWGMVPFVTDAPALFPKGTWLLVPGLRTALQAGDDAITGYVWNGSAVTPHRLTFGPLTGEERQTLLAGCLINYYSQG